MNDSLHLNKACHFVLIGNSQKYLDKLKGIPEEREKKWK